MQECSVVLCSHHFCLILLMLRLIHRFIISDCNFSCFFSISFFLSSLCFIFVRACVVSFVFFFFQLSSHLISSILSTPGFYHRVQPFASSCHFLDVGIIICERFAIFFTMLVLLSNIDEMMLEKFRSISKRPLFFVSCVSFSQS